MRGPLLGAAALSLFAGAAGAQVFDLGTATLHLPQLTVGSAVYDVVLRYDADGRLSISQLAPTLPSIVGSWYGEQPGLPGFSKLRVTFTFLGDGTYMLADDGNTTSADPTGQPGVEVGTYTYNAATGAFSTQCPYRDTDGEWGFSHGRQFGLTGCTGTAANITVQGNVMTVLVPTEANPQFTLTRITP